MTHPITDTLDMCRMMKLQQRDQVQDNPNGHGKRGDQAEWKFRHNVRRDLAWRKPNEPLLLNTPVPTAPAKSTSPATFRYATCRRQLALPESIDSTTKGAAKPTSASPAPAGQANVPGRRPYA
jgi:hypothetical protein